MSNRISIDDRLNKDKKKIKPVNELFKNTQNQNKPSDELKRQTYYITEELISALNIYKAFEDKDISVIVREALYEHIPEKYITLAKAKEKE